MRRSSIIALVSAGCFVLGVAAWIRIRFPPRLEFSIPVRVVGNLSADGAWLETPLDQGFPADQPLLQISRWEEPWMLIAVTRMEGKEAKRVEITLPLGVGYGHAQASARWYEDSGRPTYADDLSGQIQISADRFPSPDVPLLVHYDLRGQRGTVTHVFSGKAIARAEDVNLIGEGLVSRK